MLGSPFAAMGLANLAQQFGSGGESNHFFGQLSLSSFGSPQSVFAFYVLFVLPMIVLLFSAGLPAAAGLAGIGGYPGLSGSPALTQVFVYVLHLLVIPGEIQL